MSDTNKNTVVVKGIYEIYKEEQDKYNTIKSEFVKTLNDEQKDLFNKLLDQAIKLGLYKNLANIKYNSQFKSKEK